MGKVISSASMSLDGYIAYEDNRVGSLFDWFDNGPVEIVNAGDLPPFHVSQASAEYWNEWAASLGCLVVGRRLFDITDGWHGVHPLGAPVVVLTHEPPVDWSYPGSEDFSFETGGIEAAIAKAQRIAGAGIVAVAAGTVARQALDAGLLDEVAIDLVPVVLGSGRTYFGEGVSHDLGDPSTVIRGDRVTHLRFPVTR